MVLGGYSVLGKSVISLPIETEESKIIVAKFNKARAELRRGSYKRVDQFGWMMKFKDSGSEIEHEAFLAFWLSRFVFPSWEKLIKKNVTNIAVHLARGVKLAIAPAVLATIYRDLSFLKEESFNFKNNDDETLVNVWAPFQLIQIWIWERFRNLRPNPENSCNPRFARWEKKKGSTKILHKDDLFVDCGLEDFTWQPYGENENDYLGFCNLYQEKGRWVVVVDCLDEELESWALCLRVSELVALDDDCIEQYLPHRVAMQFGMNQDVPGDVARANQTPEIAWEFYTRPVKDVKIYFPSRLSEPCVTARYLEWRNKSSVVCNLQSAVGDNETGDYSKDESVCGFGNDEVDTLGLELEARIKKVEEVFAYLKS